MSETSEEVRRGRPRSAQADEAILDAAIDLFAACGFDGLTVEGVAARAGVGKTTVYRRYPSKVDLVMDAAECLAAQRAAVPDTRNARDDLLALANGLVTFLTTTAAGRMIPALVADRRRNADLAAAHARFVAERRERYKRVVQRAIERGELRSDVDVELVVDVLVAPIFYRYLISGAPLDDAFTEALVDAVLSAFRGGGVRD